MEDNKDLQRQKSPEELRAEVTKILESCKSAGEMVGHLESVRDRSSLYIIIRDLVTPAMARMIRDDTEAYKRYQNLKRDADTSWKHDHSMATMLDLDRVCTRVYTLLLQVIKSLKDTIDEQGQTLDAVTKAINTIEKQCGVAVTAWPTSDISEDDNNVHVKGSEETDKFPK